MNDQPSTESVLGEANKIIYGDRERTYGKPSKNRDYCIYVERVHWLSQSCTGSEDVAAMMVLLKTARLANQIDHRDSVVDICGYAALIERCDE